MAVVGCMISHLVGVEAMHELSYSSPMTESILRSSSELTDDCVSSHEARVSCPSQTFCLTRACPMLSGAWSRLLGDCFAAQDLHVGVRHSYYVSCGFIAHLSATCSAAERDTTLNSQTRDREREVGVFALRTSHRTKVTHDIGIQARRLYIGGF